jgi:hypothetical protein
MATLGGLGSAQTPAQEGFDVRCRNVLAVTAGESETSFYSALARLATGTDTGTAFVMLDSMTRDQAMGGMFYAYTLMGTYLHTRHLLPDSLHRKVREAFRVRTMYRGDTENHWVMYYTGLYLAAQTWPGEPGPRWFNGRSSAENMEEASGWLNHWITTTTTIGQGEFDSPTYFNVFLTPMLILQDFAADSVMRQRARMMCDLLLADFAAEHLRGNFGGGHSRDYPEDIVNPLAAPTTLYAWLYFGQPERELWNDARYRPRHRGSWELVFGAAGTYRLPDVIHHIATDRDSPYVHHELKRVRNIIRFSDVINPPVYKYTFMTSDYVLGSLQGGILQPIQQHTWDVTLADGRPNNTLFTLHPYYAGRELAMFFPEEQKFLAAEVDRYHKVYTNPNKWNSSSPFEQTFQYRNSLLLLYNIPVGEKHPHVDGFFPKSLDERFTDSTGWVFSRAGDVYIAVRPFTQYQWIEDSLCWRWRTRSLQTGLVVEIGRKADQGSFPEFQRRIRATQAEMTLRQGKPSVTYRTTGDDLMVFSFDGPRLLNGAPVEFRTDRLFEGPFMNASARQGVITLTAGGKRRVLDFPAARIIETQ